MQKQDLLELVAQNKLRALENQLERLLKKKGRHDLQDELVQLKGQHREYRQHVFEGTKAADDLGIEAARLRKSFILFIEQVFEEAPPSLGKTRSNHWLRPLLILIFFGGLILLGSMKWPSIDFVLEGRTSYLAFRLDKNWDFDQDVYLEEFSSFTVKSLEFDTFQLHIPEGEPLEEVTFSGDQFKWREIDLPAWVGTEL